MQRRAKARTPQREYASRLEADWAITLEMQRRAGDIEAWVHEGLSLRLGKGARYRPDFLVITCAGEIECHEVKGPHMREAGRVRLLAAAAAYPWFRFVLVTRPAGRWQLEEVPA